MWKHALALSLLMATGCAHKPEDKGGGVPTGAKATAGARPGKGAPAAQSGACRGDLECPAHHLCVQGVCQAIKSDLAECAEARVHFDLDAADIQPAEVPSLQRIARCLKADRAMNISIRGNADERGTQEYNLALGDKRANGVARYLENLGVSKEQLETVSYGKERPLCAEHTEACWQQNRRAGIVPQRVTR